MTNTPQEMDNRKTKQHSPKAVHFQRKISCLGWDLNMYMHKYTCSVCTCTLLLHVEASYMYIPYV